MQRKSVVLGSILSVVLFVPSVLVAQVAVRGETVHTMAGAPIKDGVVLIREGKIDRVRNVSTTLRHPQAAFSEPRSVKDGA